MSNSITAGRKLAVQIIVWQIGASLLVAMMFLMESSRAALAASLGGTVMAVATGALAWRVFAGRHAGAGRVMGRFLLGMALKWALVVGGLYLLIGHWGLPPLPVLAGMGAALAVNLASLRFKD